MATFTFQKHIPRRTFLQTTALSVALPFLESMCPALSKAAQLGSPRRFVGVSNELGFYAPHLFPEEAGSKYELTRYLQPLADLREQFTVVSGVSHPGVSRGHVSDVCILTATPNNSGSYFRNGVSLDQLMARDLGQETRFRSLTLSVAADMSTSFTPLGAMIAPESSPARLFARLFGKETPQAQRETIERLREGRTILDVVGEEAKSMQKRVGAGDRDKLDAFFTSVRELERSLSADEQWALKPKPQVGAEAPKPIVNRADFIGFENQMYELMALALETDSTRFITLHIGGGNAKLPLEGVEEGYHNLSHHGQDPTKVAQLAVVEQAQMSAWGDFLRRLQRVQEGTHTLLEQTMVMLTSNLGNASSHDTRNMPVVFAGGGFRHGQHLAFDRNNNHPLANLYVSMLQRLGLPYDRFATGTSPLPGLEMIPSA
ncbi:MAG: hypothetical protein RLZZ399_1848 [Verrucomicrobiota bacterium]|jgi:hypothetical protein